MPQTFFSQIDIQRTIGILQQWQMLLAPLSNRSVTTITLADVGAATLALQQACGATATLETIIQSLVVEDLREQLARRKPCNEGSCVA